jgi:hypothetical protein
MPAGLSNKLLVAKKGEESPEKPTDSQHLEKDFAHRSGYSVGFWFGSLTCCTLQKDATKMQPYRISRNFSFADVA